MKLIKVEYLEESTKAIFCNVTTENANFWGKIKQETRRVYLEKWQKLNMYSPFCYYSDTGKYHPLYSQVINEMILEYEKQKQS